MGMVMDKISTHTLRVEGDNIGAGTLNRPIISTHTLRVEGDVIPINHSEGILRISTHTLRVEGD